MRERESAADLFGRALEKVLIFYRQGSMFFSKREETPVGLPGCSDGWTDGWMDLACSARSAKDGWGVAAPPQRNFLLEVQCLYTLALREKVPHFSSIFWTFSNGALFN